VKIHGPRKRNTSSHISVHRARDLHYLRREIEKTIFFKEDRCEKVVDVNDGRARRFLSGETSRGVRLPREIVIMPSWFYKDTRARPVFSHLSAPGFPILLLRNLAIADDTVRKRSDVIYWDPNRGHVKFIFMSLSFSLPLSTLCQLTYRIGEHFDYIYLGHSCHNYKPI